MKRAERAGTATRARLRVFLGTATAVAATGTVLLVAGASSAAAAVPLTVSPSTSTTAQTSAAAPTSTKAASAPPARSDVSVTLRPSDYRVVTGQPVTLTATTVGSAPKAHPSAPVTFYADGEVLGTANSGPVLIGPGHVGDSPQTTQSVLTTTTLPVGTRIITARYPGDATNNPATSNGARVDVLGGVFNDTATGITYSGSWNYYGPGRGLGDYRDDVHATSAAGDSFSFTFSGSSIVYTAELSSGAATAEIFLDGVSQGTVRPFTAQPRNLGQQEIYRSARLPSGQHTLKVVNQTPHYWLLLDSLTVG